MAGTLKFRGGHCGVSLIFSATSLIAKARNCLDGAILWRMAEVKDQGRTPAGVVLTATELLQEVPASVASMRGGGSYGAHTPRCP